MAMGVGSNESGELPESHEINVTPFIDVMLVLLIIFMVAAPLATVSVPVDLPASEADPQPTPDEPVYLTLQQDLSLTLGDDEAVLPGQLKASLASRGIGTETRLLLRADQRVNYGDLMDVMNELSAAGYLKLALVGLEHSGAVNP